MKTTHRLAVWRKADELARRLCATLASQTTAPHADLVARLRALAVDLPLTIDAGARHPVQYQFARQVDSAIALTHEIKYCLILLQALGRITATDGARFDARADQLQRMLAGLRRTLDDPPLARQRKNARSWQA
jgi:four helix bundle protein